MPMNATVAVLFVAWSLRVQKRAKQKRQKPKKRETLPGPADKAHVESLVRKCSDAADDLVPELLAGLAADLLQGAGRGGAGRVAAVEDAA